MIKLKQKGILADRFKVEGWDKIAFWADGSWVEVGTGYGGEQDGINPLFCMSRSSFYDQTSREIRAMVKAIEIALNTGCDREQIYDKLMEQGVAVK